MGNMPGGRRTCFRAAAAAAILILSACGSTGSTGPDASAPASTAASAPGTPAPAPPSAAASASPSASAAPPSASASASATPSGPSPAQAEPVPAPSKSAPVSLAIPAIGTRTPLMRLELDDQGSLEVPPGKPGSPAGWYVHSPAPGDPGPAVILGHVNAEGGGSGVFADLRKLQPGEKIEVTREDGSTAVFSVLRGEQYPKDSFPTLEVYGNTAGPELRLITCDGYDAKTGTFDDNYVVYARLG